MDTGKVEYAPDYKSKSRPSLYAKFEKQQRDAAITVEHQRLRSAVVEAAKGWRKRRSSIEAKVEFPFDKLDLAVAANEDFYKTIDALMVFEVEHNIE